MYANKITDTEVSNNRIASLPTRPTASAAFGGKGYSAAEMKEAFDKLPLIIIHRFNLLLEDIRRTDEEAMSAQMPTTIKTGHSLMDMFQDITNGNFSAYLKVGDQSLAKAIADIHSEIQSIRDYLGYYDSENS